MARLRGTKHRFLRRVLLQPQVVREELLRNRAHVAQLWGRYGVLETSLQRTGEAATILRAGFGELSEQTIFGGG